MSQSQITRDVYDAFLAIEEHIIGKGPAYAFDLEKIGNAQFGEKFMGVFASDNIPKKFNYCIANLDPQHLPGSHWVALARVKNNEYMVYDSFGRKTTSILPDLDLKTIDTDHDAEQAPNEDNCGARAMAWLMCFDLLGPELAQTI